MRKKIIAANWKMNGSLVANESLLNELKKINIPSNAEVIIFPSFVYIEQVKSILKGSSIKIGAQNLASEEKGAFTGEVSGNMIKEIGCDYVLVGHSERRELYGESDGVVAKKVSLAIKQGLTPVLCIGETLAQREANETSNVVKKQLKAVIDANGIDAFSQIVLAYEPVWAIGTGKTATQDQAQEVHQVIRTYLSEFNAEIAQKISILYGGSVKANSAENLFKMPDVDGGLVGGASLDAQEFSAIILAA